MSEQFIPINDVLNRILQKRKDDNLYRTLHVNDSLIDFCSNDYVSFARSVELKDKVKNIAASFEHLSGATGSRSISGNTSFAEELEKQLATFHHAEAGLLFNSGYDANIGLFSCIAKKEDTIICDELIHASIIDGCRLSYANRFKFAHNDVSDLEKKLQHAKGTVFVAVESVYSMDGDMAPLKEIAALCKRYNANLIIDEAHATGVFGDHGRGLANQLGVEQDAFARVHTFGKGIGCHGAIVLGSEVLRNYLINFARSFIFTTALPVHSLITIKCAYDHMASDDFYNGHLHRMIHHFKNNFKGNEPIHLIESSTPIQCVVIPGNEKVKRIARQLQDNGFDIRAIVNPTVPVGKERLRISLHIHNTLEEVDALLMVLNQIINQ